MSSRRSRHVSFGRRLLLMVAGHGAGVALVVLLLLLLHGAMEARQHEATRAFMEEQWIADGLTAVVMRQLAAAAAYQRNREEDLLTDFQQSGREAGELLRRYLSHDLSPPQRLQLESVKEAHQRLEVAAALALELSARGRSEGASDAAVAMAQHGLELQEATFEFLQMRQQSLEEIRRRSAMSLRMVYVGGMVFALLTVLAAVLWGRFLQRRLAGPLQMLEAAATRIRDGELTVKVPVPEERELAAVAGSFNRMSTALADARASEEQRTAQLRDAVKRLQEAQAELVQTEKLSAMGRTMAGLAHELNNPLATVLGYSQLLERHLREQEPRDRELAEELVSPIVGEATRARDLVRDLLSFAREPRTLRESVPVEQVIRATARSWEKTLEREGIGLDIDTGSSEQWVEGDAGRMEQALHNLISNAHDALTTATPSVGSPMIRIVVHDREDWVDVAVEDNGPGFGDPDRAFEPFYTTKPIGQGTGLGLALVRGYTEECGGKALVENLPEGGARVTLSFRFAEPSTRNDDPGGEPTEPAEVRPESQALRVLVVEDEAPLRALQRRLLERAGATVAVAESGHEAQRMLVQGEEVDVVVSDVKMPDGSGLELYAWATSERPELVDHFLFVTGDVGGREIAELARQQPERVLSKPFYGDSYVRRVMAAAGPPQH